MDHPAEQDKPETRRKTELQDRHEQPALQQLAEAWNEKAAQRRDYVSS
jgi:hypothetical protein